ncbi:hypothetical protein F5Y04DRAFT_280592 [Hypomontagnella monticulosa]|nr:hypothetical protein F5Y04DRAFT_280592 [Hypomontagnella monticulosa]
MASTRPPCLVCDKDEGKYKCPQCNLYTCSLPCFREHRDNHPKNSLLDLVRPRATSTSGNDETSHDESRISSHTAESSPRSTTSERSGIADMPEYKELTQKYPNLERLLWNIAAATDPPPTNGTTNGANGKNGVQPGSGRGPRKTNQPWTQDMGYENGIEVLRRTRDSPGNDRDALREYCELVRLHSARRESANAAEKVRQQAAKDDAKAIGDLIRAEGSD